MQPLAVLVVLFFLQACSLHSANPMSDRPQSQLSSVSLSSERAPQADFRLGEYQWQYRVVLLFAPFEEFPAYQQQMQAWQTNTAGIRNRDLKLVEVFATGESRADGQAITPATAQQLRGQFGVSTEDFVVILVGKDGTQKQRYQTSIDLAMLFGTIDAMPMRQQEMRSQQSPQ